jgi:hypothetical protein
MKGVVAYLRDHPKAADTLEGINQWWLPKDEARSRDDVARALEKLVAQGRIEKHVAPEGRRLFRRRRAV